MIKALRATLLAIVCCLPGFAEIPRMLNYQGRIQVGTQNFDGTGQFKFALVNGAGTQTYWSNDGTGSAGGQPSAAVALPVIKGLYSVLLGDTTRPNMTVLPIDAFAADETFLRIWFNNGSSGFQQLMPDQRIAAVGYAIVAASVTDGAITTAKLANGAITGVKLAAASVSGAQLSDGAVSSSKIAAGAVARPQLADGAVDPSKVDGQFGLWKKSGTQFTHGGNIGIGVTNPRVPLEVSGFGTLALFQGSSSTGTWLGVSNTSEGGKQWLLGSSGGAGGQVAGKLVFAPDGQSSPRMQLDPNGNLYLTGEISALNVVSRSPSGLQSSAIAFSQGSDRLPSQVFEANGDGVGGAKTMDEISLVIPAPGYVQINAFLDLDKNSNSAFLKFAFVLYEATAGQVELTRVLFEGWQTAGTVPSVVRTPLHLCWVLPVDAPKTVTLRTQGVLEAGSPATPTLTWGHNLTGVYIPRLAQ